MTTSLAPDTSPNGQPNAHEPDPAELARRTAELASVRTTVANLEDALSISRRRLEDRDTDLAQLRQEFETFKITVCRTAATYAEKHGWCGEVNGALEEMGLQPYEADWTVTLTVTGTIARTVSARSEQAAIDDVRGDVGLYENRVYDLGDDRLYVTDVTAEASED